jgi:alkylhydroperoxidase/carboxymuconolactone decarboxylase family protein YurZ
MSSPWVPRAPAYVNSLVPSVGEQFAALRKSVYAAGPLDRVTCELVMLGAFATARHQMPFKNHATMARDAGIPLAAARQAVMITLCSTTTMNDVANALSWLEEVYASGDKA